MLHIYAALLFLLLSADPLLVGEGKPTSLSDARAAVEANLRTREGKAYDEQLGTDFVQNHLGAVRQCKQSAGGDLQNFWFLLKLNKDGTVQEVLLHPETKIGICAGEALRKDKFPPPPKPDYWASIYFKLVR